MAAEIPAYNELLWPTLRAVRSLGQMAKIDEIVERVTQDVGFSDEQLAVLHNDGPRTQIEYRLAWARSYLKGMGALDNPQRGLWTVTDIGKDLKESEIEPLWQDHTSRLRAARKQAKNDAKNGGIAESSTGEDSETSDWREQLLAALLAMDPTAFEHLSQRLLRAAGFINTNVTQRSGDGGIDGSGVYRLSLVSFPVFFQCKKYRGSVGPEKVRDFRGAMAGRGDKGLLITTGTFTAEAQKEATRDGAPPIDLIDGERLCDLLKEHGLGVRTMTRTIEDVQVNVEFFASLVQ